MKNKNNIYNFGECAKSSKNKIIICEENGRKFTVNNRSKSNILKVKVDACLKFEGRICDFLIINTNQDYAYFIELKGKNVKKAIEQLENSIKEVQKKENNFITKEFSKKNAHIVLSRYPKANKDINKYKELFRKNLKTNLHIKNNQAEITI